MIYVCLICIYFLYKATLLINIQRRLIYGCCNVTWTCDILIFIILCVCGRSGNLLPAINRQFSLYCGVQIPVHCDNVIITRFLKEITWKPKGASKFSNIVSNIAGNCVAEASTPSKFPARRSKLCGKYRHPHLAILLVMLLGILPAILRAVLFFSAILLAISVISMKKLIINLQKGEIKC